MGRAKELSSHLAVGGVTVGQAMDLVEAELQRWSCKSYMHLTRALSVVRSRHIELETIFSQPTEATPVPVAVATVAFFFDTATERITYQFEQDNVQHEVGGMGLAAGQYEKWLDRIIGDKLQVRNLHNLATSFEESRLAPPAIRSEQSSEAEQLQGFGESEISADAMRQPHESETADAGEPLGLGSQLARRMSRELGVAEMDLSTLLVNIFDAADEEDEFELTHKEVADLLYATPMGLADWDIKQLLTQATELDTGKIEYKPFVEAAPKFVDALLQRRKDFEARIGPNPTQVTLEHIDLCYGEEIEELARAAREAFTAKDAAGNQTLSRHEFRTCLNSRAERFSEQEIQMLMQMCKEDDFGQVPYDDFVPLLKELRIDALHNAAIETDVGSLLLHLVLLANREMEQSSAQDNVMTIWDLRIVLMNADQLCLSRMQIHVILCILHPDERGYVDLEYFLRVCCTVVPQMFNTAAFVEKAQAIAKEKAELVAKQEMEELQGLAGGGLTASKRRNDDEDPEEMQANAPDRDAVEKELIRIANQADTQYTQHSARATLDVKRFLECMRSESVQSCQLSESELRGFIAEAEIVERGQVAYQEHIRTWVPIIFELRKSRIYDEILHKDWGWGATHLADLSLYEQRFQLRTRHSSQVSRGNSRRPSHSRLSSKGSAAGGRLTRSNTLQSLGSDESVSRRRRRRSLSRQGSRSLSRQGSVRSLADSVSSADTQFSGRSAVSERGGPTRRTLSRKNSRADM